MEQSAQQVDQAAQRQDRSAHPIDALMRTVMESIKAMVDVNTILGVPVEAPDGTVIIPVSRVSFGFVAGGSEFETQEQGTQGFPFGGGSGAGVSLSPVAFLVVGQGQVRLLPVSERAFYDRLLDVAPRFVEQLQRLAGAEQRRSAEGMGQDGPGASGSGGEGEPAQRGRPVRLGAGAEGGRDQGQSGEGGSRGGEDRSDGSGQQGRRKTLSLRFE